MALLLIEGFDDGLAIDRWDSAGIVAADISATYGRNGKGIRLGDTPANYLKINAPSHDEMLVGFAVKIVDYGGTKERFMSPHSSNYLHVAVNDSSEKIGVYNQVTASVDWAASGSLPINSWHYVEMHLVTKNSPDGSYEIRVDGSTVVSASSIDTYYSGLLSQMLICGTVDDAYVDDLYYKRGAGLTFLGDSKVTTQLPNGNGNSSAMLGSDSNSVDNYALVNNNAAIPPSTAAYVGSATTTDKDTYLMDDLVGTPTVHAVQTTLYAESTDTGAKQVRPIIRSGGTDYAGADVPMVNSSYKVVDEVWETDPDTAATWLYGGVNSMEVGQEVRD